MKMKKIEQRRGRVPSVPLLGSATISSSFFLFKMAGRKYKVRNERNCVLYSKMVVGRKPKELTAQRLVQKNFV